MKKSLKNFIVKNKLIIFAVVTIFISMLVLNFITPLIMDDYNYSFGLNGRISNLKDIFEYQIWFYFNWGGRNIAHTIAQFFLMNNKIIFNIFNSIVFIILLLLILNFSNFNRTEVKNKFLYLWKKRRKRDLNPRAGCPTYTLSRGASSASWVFLQSSPSLQWAFVIIQVL